jgi:DNA-binding beta-propeller fold protein YncE
MDLSRRLRHVIALCALSVSVAVMLVVAVDPAHASYELVETFGNHSLEESIGDGSVGITDDYMTGRVYVADGFHNRLTFFGLEGAFAGAWGWDVTATGPDKAGVDQVEEVVVSATGGDFALNFDGGRGLSGLEHSKTDPIPYNASAQAVAEALNALSNIKDEGGKVSVSGGPAYKIVLEDGEGDSQRSRISSENVSLSGSVTNGQFRDGEAAFETCLIHNGDKCREGQPNFSESGENDGEFERPQGIAVDNSCQLHKPALTGSECKDFDAFDGDVYALNPAGKEGIVQIFTPEGQFVTRFGIRGTSTPEEIGATTSAGIAVDPDGSGDVFITDRENGGRVMIFKPASAIDYVFEGEFANGDNPGKVTADSSGDVFVSNEKFVYKFPAGDLQTEEWKHEDNHSIEGLAVNPLNGDSFFYTEGNSEYHELGATGTELSHWKGVQKEKETFGLAYNPFAKWTKGTAVRPPGLLYALDRGLHEGLVWAQPEIKPPSVGAEFVSGDRVGTGFATLEGLVNAHGFDTNYTFEYGPEECATSGQNCISTTVSDLGSANENVVATATVTGLAPGSTYYFRVLPTSHCNPEEVAEVCAPGAVPFSAFSTFGSSGVGLPDGRVYELVSPPIKNGNEVLQPNPVAANCFECVGGINDTHFPMQSSPDGSSIVYEGGGPFAATGDGINENEYLSKRLVGGGWSGPGDPADLTPASASRNAAALQGYKGFSTDLSRGILYERTPSLSPLAAPGAAGYPNLYLTNTAAPGAEPLPLVTSKPPTQPPASFSLTFAGASSSFGSIIFEANDSLPTENGSGPEYGLYEWKDGALRTVNVLPESETKEPEAVFGSGKELQNAAGDPDFSHAISDDGAKIFWTGKKGGRRVYVREGGATTVEIADPAGHGAFLTASANGAKVLLSDGRLFNLEVEDPVTKAPLEEADLDESQNGFMGILGASEDLSVVYFTDTAILTPGESNSEGFEAKAGEPNLYVWKGGATKFISTLSGVDGATNFGIDASVTYSGDWTASPSDRTAQATANGEYLAFMSQAKLTRYDNTDALTENADYEIYEYDSTTGRLTCASCNPTGGRPIGSSRLSLIKPGSGFLPQPENLESNGRLFFDSADALSLQDTNNGFEDVYEYEPSGLAGCVAKPGCISLISSGQEETNSSFVNATSSGSDVFFVTRSPLLPEDQDGLVDLYDARVDGVSLRSPGSETCVSNAECRGAIPTPPRLPSPFDDAPSGSGNVLQSATAPSQLAPPATTPPKPLTRAQKLAKAIKACQKQKKQKRAECIARARKQYGVKTKAKQGHRAAATKSAGVRGRGK